MLQLFYLPTKFDGKSGRKSDYLNCVTSASRQACAHGYFIDDMMFYAFEIIPFHLHDTLFPFGSKCLFFLSANRSALAKRACCCLYWPIRKSMGMWLFSAERKKNGIRYTQRHAGTLSPSFSPWIPIFTLENQVAPLNNHMLIGRKSVSCCAVFFLHFSSSHRRCRHFR